MSRRHSRSRSQEPDTVWKGLLEQQGVADTIAQAIQAANRPPREDFESFAWDRAVTVAMRFAEEYPSAPEGFQPYLYVDLTRWGWRTNLQQLRGHAPKSDEATGDIIETPTPRWSAWWGTSFDAYQDSEGRTALEHRALFARNLSSDDPLAILLKLEWLERLHHRVRVDARSGAFTSTSEDPFCLDDACRDLAVIAGYCRRHYGQHRNLWGAENGTQTVCTRDGCGALSHGRGLCLDHYQQEWRRHQTAGTTWEKTCTITDCANAPADGRLCVEHAEGQRATIENACSIEGCHRSRKTGRGETKCNYHVRQARAERAAPCTIPDCDRPGIGGYGMCRRHYETDRLRRKAQPEAAAA